MLHARFVVKTSNAVPTAALAARAVLSMWGIYFFTREIPPVHGQLRDAFSAERYSPTSSDHNLAVRGARRGRILGGKFGAELGCSRAGSVGADCSELNEMQNDLLNAATMYLNAGLALLPIDHTTKRPLMRMLPRSEDDKPTWNPLRENRADLVEVRRWLNADARAIGLIAGAPSGGLLVLDFDEMRMYEAWEREVGNLASGLPKQETGGGNRQVFLRCPNPGENEKLAFVPDDTQKEGRRIGIETRGEGGYAVLPPSLHPSKNYYRMLPGPTLAEIPNVSQAHADALLAAARKLDEMPFTKQEQANRLAQALAAHQRKLAQSNGHGDVIGAFNRGHSVESFLEHHGYSRAYGNRFKRPQGKSGSVIVEDGRSVHFSSNDPLNDGRISSGCGVHDTFDLFCHFDHKGDVSAAVKAAADLLGMKFHRANAQKRICTLSPMLVCMDDVEAKDVEWFWLGKIPMGYITMFVGRGGVGKGYVSVDLASRASTGTPHIDGTPCPKGSVLIISLEEGKRDILKPRLEAHKADCKKIRLLEGVRRQVEGEEPSEISFTLEHVGVLEDALKQMPDCKLVIIDPIGDFLGCDTDAHRDNEVRGVLTPVRQLAEKYGVAVLIIAHRRKSSGSNADDLALGSRAFTALSRVVWHLVPDPDNKHRRLMLPGKNNLAPEGDGLAFAICGDPASVMWERESVQMSADEALAVENGEDEKPGPEPVKQSAAKDWLTARLAAGPMLVGDKRNPDKGTLRAEAEAAGQSWGTIRRASDELGVVKERCEYTQKYQWRLPREGAQSGCATSPDENNLRNLRNQTNSKENESVLVAEDGGCAGSNDLSNQNDDFDPNADWRPPNG